MAIPLILGPIVSMLAGKGMDLLAGAIEGGADKAVDFIEEKTGIKIEPDTKLTPEQEAKLRELEMIERNELKRLALENKKEDNRHEETQQALANSNVADSRNMQVEALKSDDKWAKRFIYIFSGLWSIFAMVYILMITFVDIPDGNVRFADTILGFLLGTVIASIINYFVGSSSGSKEKTEALSKALSVNKK